MHLYGQTVSNAAHFPVDEEIRKNIPYMVLDKDHASINPQWFPLAQM